MADLEELVLSISADTRQMQRALQKLQGDVKTAGDGIDNAFKAPKIDNVSKSIGKTRFETANLAAQFQDIAVQLQGGQSPFTIALQQGTQISQVLGSQGAGGVVGLLGTAFKSLISPVSLATIGIIALGGFAVQYASKAIGAVSDLDDKLKAHGELIRGLKDAYGDAGKGIDTAVKEAIVVLQGLLNFKTDDIKKEFVSLSGSISKSLSDFRVTGLGPAIEENSKKFSAFNDVITTFKASVKDGQPDVLAFRRAVQQISDSTADEKTKNLAKEILELTTKAAGAQLAIESTAKATRLFSNEARDAAEQGEAFAKAMKSLSSTVTPDLTDRQKIVENYGKALEKASGTEERLAAARVRDSQLSVLAANEQKKAQEKAASSAESAEKRFQGALDSVSKRNASVGGMAMAVGEGVGALARLETQERLTEQAMQSFGKVSEENAEKIRKQSEAAGLAADALARAQIASQIDFGGKTALLTSDDVAIAQQLRSIYGNDVVSALGSADAAALRFNRTTSDIAKSIQSGLVTGLADIVDGTKSAAEGFADLGKSILRMLEEAAIKALIVQPLFAALGLGGGAGGLFGGLIPKFAGGTSFAPGGVALVGERGPELVNIPRGGQVIPNHRLASGDGGGLSVTVVQHNNFSSGVTPTDQAFISQQIQKSKRETVQETISAIRQGQRNSSTFLNG